MSEAEKTPKIGRTDDPQQPSAPPCVVTFKQLADGKNELLIEHKGQKYLLRATKNGKLLLNK
ncbi:MAG: hemin uptake protein HemP [Fuerstiella sp.]